MRQHSNLAKDTAEKVVKDIRRATRKQYSAEEKIRIVLEGLRGEDSIAELCRREGIAQNLYYRWSKDFLEAGKKRLAGDTARHLHPTGSYRMADPVERSSPTRSSPSFGQEQRGVAHRRQHRQAAGLAAQDLSAPTRSPCQLAPIVPLEL